jgi:hypothetical protein
MPANIPWRLIGLLAALIAIVAIPALLVRSCDKHRNEAAQARVDQGQKGALANSAADAIDTVGNAAARERASDDLTRSNAEEIRNAPGANAPINPAAHDAGLRALCRRQAYRDSKRCRLLQPHS